MSFIAKKIGKKTFARHLAAYEPRDTLYENDTSGKKRVRRELPPGLSPKDAKVLQKIRKRAHYLDKGMNLCGFRVGWTFLLGLIPFVGDAVDALLNYNLVLKKAKECDVPDYIIAQMWVNNMVSLGVGLIPLVGDIILGIWKANSRNAHLLEEYLALRAQENPHYADQASYGAVQQPTRTQAQQPVAAPPKGAERSPPAVPGRK